MNKSKRLIIAAGGTGGHVFPGLTIACYLIEHGWQVHWLGTANHIEAHLVPQYGIKINFITIAALRGKGVKAMLLAPIRLFKAWRQAFVIIRDFKPNVVLGMGGYISCPGVIAAWSLNIPIVLHEQNRIAGLTNKYLAKIANKVTQAFPGALYKAQVVGNPLRRDILSLPQPEVRLVGRQGPIRILVVGGSQGAHILNQIMPKVAAKLGEAITIWHQSGKIDQYQVMQAYIKTGWLQHKVNAFIKNMASAYAWADIIICRAGALTVSEIAAVGLPALFIPFQHKDKQQYWNAVPFERIGAAKIFEQSQFTANAVTSVLISLDRLTLLQMAKKFHSKAIFGATEKISKEIISTAK